MEDEIKMDKFYLNYGDYDDIGMENGTGQNHKTNSQFKDDFNMLQSILGLC